MIKKTIMALTIIAALAVLALFGASWYFSSQLISPKPYTCEKEHFIYCGGARELGVPFEEVSFRNDEGLVLKGWFFPKKGSVKAVVMVHGITADKREGLRWVKALTAGGYSALLFDLRNHGGSDRDRTGMGLLEKKDVSAAVTYLERERGVRKVGLFGVSMGAATGIHAMAEDTRIAAGVFEAPFAHLGDLLGDMAVRDFGLPRFPIIPAVLRIYGHRGGFDPSLMNPEDLVGKISPRPVFIIHCDRDDYTPYGHGLRVFRAAGEPKTMWTAHCDKHARAWQSDPAGAERKVVDFYRENLK